MDSKRKAASGAAASPESETRAAKRLKTPDALPDGEDAEATSKAGFKFIRDLEQARSKQGNAIVTHFEKLPDKASHPDYYEATLLPISLETIGNKLQKRQYPTLTPMEADLKRMIANAKAYNRRDSVVFEDAERVRKFVSSWMKENNPAYRDPKYAALPTPLPGEEQKTVPRATPTTPAAPAASTTKAAVEEVTPVKESGRGRSRRLTKASATPASPPPKEELAPEPAKANDSKKSDFAGQNFQQAQETIVREMIELEDENGENFTGSFLNLPSRKLHDYYRLISKPMALNPLRKKVIGQVGRNEPSNQSRFSTWGEFEDEASLIWNNAKEYNEDESEIFTLAVSLEEFFKKRIAEARRVVPAPAEDAPRLKLKPPTQPAKIKLKIGGGRESSAGTPGEAAPNESSTSKAQAAAGVSVDSDALKRQQQMVQAGVSERHLSMSSHRAASQPDQTRAAASGSTPAAIPAQASQDSKDADTPMPLVGDGKSDTVTNRSLSAAARTSHAPESSQGAAPSNGTTPTMPPPVVAGSGVSNGVSRPTPFTPVPARPHRTAIASDGVSFDLDSVGRRPGQDLSDALITNLVVSTHPAMTEIPKYQIKIPTTKDKREIHVWDTLDSSQYFVQIIPTIADGVLREREVKLFVLVNGQRLEPSASATMRLGPNQPVYEVYFQRGAVNRVEVDMCAGPVKGAAPHEFDFERIYFYGFVQRE